MASVSASIDSGVSGGVAALSSQLGTQSGSLGNVITLVTGLIQHPPHSIGDLGQTLNQLPLPNLAPSSSFATQLTSLKGAVPSDLSGVTGTLQNSLGTFAAGLGQNLTGALTPVLDAAVAIFKLTQIDWTCSGPAPHAARRLALATPSTSGASSNASLANASAELDVLQNLLAAIPQPFGVESLLELLGRAAGGLNEIRLPASLSIPLASELLDPLQTLLLWKTEDTAALGSGLAATLGQISGFVGKVDGLAGALASDLTALGVQLDTSALATNADALLGQVNALASAVSSGDLSSSTPGVTELNARLDEYAALRTALAAPLAQAPSIQQRLAAFPDELGFAMDRLVATLSPASFVPLLDRIPALSADTGAADAVKAHFQPVVDWLQNLIDKLDLKAIQEPLKAVADAARSAVDGLEQGLAAIALEVRSIFSQVESLIAGLDVNALVDQVKSAISEFATELTTELTSLFAPIRDEVSSIVDQISSGIADFKPEDIIQKLRDVIDQLTSVLNSPELGALVAKVKSAFDTAASQLKGLSFSPVTDQVVSAIDSLTQSLESIDASQLNSVLEAALQAAVALLPHDLAPITNPLIDDLGQLINADDGPVKLIDSIKDEPQKLLDKIKSFDPAALIGDALSKPYEQLLAQMQEFKPSQLLAPVSQELDSLKQRVISEADPSALLRPLTQPFSDLVHAFDAFKPDTLVAPLQAALDQAISTVTNAIPLDAVFAQIDSAFKAVSDVVDFGKKLVALLNQIKALLSGFGDAPSALTAFVNGVLDRVTSVDASVLSGPLAALTAAVDATQASALSARFTSAATPLEAALATLRADQRIAALVQAFADFPRAALQALPDSAEKTAALAAFARFTPLDPSFSAPYQALNALAQGLNATQSALAAKLGDWDARYHPTDGVLDTLRVSTLTAAELANGIREVLEPQFSAPLAKLLGLVTPLAAPIGAVFDVLSGLMTTLDTKVADLLLGPDSLGGIRDALEALVARIRGFNLGFLSDNLNDLFNELKSKVDALDPANLIAPIDAAFKQTLDAISLDQILPQADVQKLDDDFSQVIDKLKALDPKTLVVDVIQPEFEQKVLPLVEAFDFTEVLQAIIDALEGLTDELKTEMGRVNTEYQKMLAAVPTGGGGSAGVSL